MEEAIEIGFIKNQIYNSVQGHLGISRWSNKGMSLQQSWVMQTLFAIAAVSSAIWWLADMSK